MHCVYVYIWLWTPSSFFKSTVSLKSSYFRAESGAVPLRSAATILGFRSGFWSHFPAEDINLCPGKRQRTPVNSSVLTKHYLYRSWIHFSLSLVRREPSSSAQFPPRCDVSGRVHFVRNVTEWNVHISYFTETIKDTEKIDIWIRFKLLSRGECAVSSCFGNVCCGLIVARSDHDGFSLNKLFPEY